MKIKKLFRALFGFLGKNYRHVLAIAVLIASAVAGAFPFRTAYIRLVSSFVDLFYSLKYYFFYLFDIDINFNVPVIQIEKSFFETFLPVDYEEFADKTSSYFQTLFSLDNFFAYNNDVLVNLSDFLTYFLLLAPTLILCVVLIGKLLSDKKNDDRQGEETKALKRYKRFEGKVLYPTIRWVKDYIDFLRTHSVYIKLFLAIWILNLNFGTIAIEFFAFYYYFVASFDFLHIYSQVVKLTLDLSFPLTTLPVPIWVIIVYVVIRVVSRRIGFKKLGIREAANCGFIQSFGIFMYVNGTVGMGKTTTLTDMSLSLSNIWRDKALELLQDNDYRFPKFPWILFEKQLCFAISEHTIYNLVTTEDYVRAHYKPTSEMLFGYDVERYGTEYYDGKVNYKLEDVLVNYAKEYFLYIHETSYIISNYGVREDQMKFDNGNLPVWNLDFFHRDGRFEAEQSVYSHVLDFDMLRMAKQVKENNENRNLLEYGIIDWTEGGKERGNQLTNAGLKITDEETNSKNDGLNDRCKLSRHPATVDNYPFIMVLMDDQRAESLNADLKDITSIINISGRSEEKLLLPLFFVEEIVIDFTRVHFDRYYTDFRYRRGDTTLPLYLLKNFAAACAHLRDRVYSQFGCIDETILTEDYKQEFAEHKYYIMPKKIYANRFCTDAYSGYFSERIRTCKKGLNDLPSFSSTRATETELLSENSYFFDRLYKRKK